MDPYRSYHAADFALDERFQRWVLQADPEAADFWEQWLAKHPDQQTKIEEARQLLLALGRTTSPSDDQRNTRIKQAVLSRVTSTSASPWRWALPQWGWLAASILVLLLVGGGGFWGYQWWTYVRYDTGYGETQTLVLPDGSEVTLKANSRLWHPRRWDLEQDREVWLTGEAFFHVTKTMIPHQGPYSWRPSSFVVHASEAVDVAVLGTEFNVNTRDKETEVVLKSGSVRVEVNHEAQPQTVLMEPGDRVEIAHRRGTLTQQRIDPQAPVPWRDNMLIFDEVTLSEVAERLRYTYGVDIVFEDPTLAQRKFKGFVPTDNLEVLLEAFAELYNVHIQQDDNQIIFSRTKNSK